MNRKQKLINMRNKIIDNPFLWLLYNNRIFKLLKKETAIVRIDRLLDRIERDEYRKRAEEIEKIRNKYNGHMNF